jgi:hypothetical protein
MEQLGFDDGKHDGVLGLLRISAILGVFDTGQE